MPLRILVLDDDAVDREAVRRIIGAAGMSATVLEAATVDEALAVLAEHEADCLLLDYRLPGTDGLAALERLRQARIDCPVIALTGHADQETAVAMMKAGAADYLVKRTLTAEGLARSVRHALHAAAAERERRALLAREQAAREEAQAANRAKDAFLATLSHELRTPLNSIVGWTRLLTTGSLEGAASRRALDTVERNAMLLAKLIDDLLDISRIVTGKLTIDSQPVALASLIGAVIESQRPAAASANVDLAYLPPPNDVQVMGDAARLQQVVTNLLSNALKFTPPGGWVRVALTCDADGAHVTVADSGVGIDPRFLPLVFEQFRQADPTTTRRQGGLGLGLAIVRRLVELHGGRVAAESQGAGMGAVFHVVLPAIQAVAAVHDSGLDVSSPPDEDLRGVSVLVVDDDADGRSLMATLLERRGARVRTAASAAEALAAARGDYPDVLVSDIAMPEQDGYGLLAQIRALAPARDLPAVAVTAYTAPEVRSRALIAGFDAHLVKPVDASHLIATVAALGARSVVSVPPRD